MSFGLLIYFLLLYNGGLDNGTYALLGKVIKVCGASIKQTQAGSPNYCSLKLCISAKKDRKGDVFGSQFRKKQLGLAVALASTAFTAHAQIEEVLVTATKRTESMQDIPVAVSALGEESLDQLGISNFEDYLLQLPNVTAGGTGPGQNTIYIRGVASTTPGLTVAGVAGLAPNVALYLDEQPLSQPGRNLDVYAADLARVEVLSGPQGTLSELALRPVRFD